VGGSLERILFLSKKGQIFEKEGKKERRRKKKK